MSQFQASYNELKAVVSALQTNLQETDNRVQALEDRNVTATAKIDRVEATVKDLQQNASSDTEVFEELAERERRSTNVIIFEVKESTSQGKREREERDLGGILQLFKEIDVDLTLDNVKLARREEEKKEGTIRPLKVVFQSKEDRDKVLSKSFKLAKAKEDVWRKVSIKADLTLKQRNLERNLEKSAASKNLLRSKEEIEEGRAWKVVGKRGEKVLRMVKLYPEEVVLESGHVQLKDQIEERGQVRTRKRGRRESGSPSSPTSRRARILPSPFGDQ